jgi:3-deoxy-D-manno-octulosonic-acid transferase
MAWFMYQVALALLLVAAAPFLLVRRGRHYVQTFSRRLGFAAASPVDMAAPLWLHAVSVGEVGVAAALIRSLPTDTPLLVSTITPTGLQEACRLLGDRAEIRLHPFDFGFALKPFFDRLEPTALVLVEGDLWPLALRYSRQRGLPIVVINGRISDRNFARLRRLRAFIRPLFEPVDFFAMQSSQDRERLLELGVPAEKIEVTGNVKFDSPAPTRNSDLEGTIARLAGGRAVLVAGSTMAGEEEMVLDAFDRVGSRRAVLLLAPRHPERWPAVVEQLKARGTDFLRRSDLTGSSSVSENHQPAVLLLDSLGELAGLYAVANAAFIGGTLVPTGGHNPLEAARYATPVVVGPSMQNFPEISRLFDEASAWQRVHDAESLGACWNRWLDDPDRAVQLGHAGERIVAKNRGAVKRTLTILTRWLPALED